MKTVSEIIACNWNSAAQLKQDSQVLKRVCSGIKAALKYDGLSYEEYASVTAACGTLDKLSDVKKQAAKVVAQSEKLVDEIRIAVEKLVVARVEQLDLAGVVALSAHAGFFQWTLHQHVDTYFAAKRTIEGCRRDGKNGFVDLVMARHRHDKVFVEEAIEILWSNFQTHRAQFEKIHAVLIASIKLHGNFTDRHLSEAEAD